MKKVFAALSLLLVLTVFAGADIYVKSKLHSDAFSIMGQNQPARDEIMEQWIGDDKFAYISQGQSIILDLKKNIALIVAHKEKTYVETPLPLDMSKLFPPEMAQMMGAMMKMTVTVAANGQTKTIGQWKCDGYDVGISMMMMPMKMTVWATTDVPFDVNKYMEKIYGAFLKATMRLDDVAVKEMMKVKGFQVASETTADMMGAKIKTTTEVIEISKKNPDAGVYTAPAGYKKTDKLPMEGLRE